MLQAPPLRSSTGLAKLGDVVEVRSPVGDETLAVFPPAHPAGPALEVMTGVDPVERVGRFGRGPKPSVIIHLLGYFHVRLRRAGHVAPGNAGADGVNLANPPVDHQLAESVEIP